MLSLFNGSTDVSENLLPHDGVVNYHGKIFPNEVADTFFQSLMHEIEWRHDEAVMFQKVIVTKRKVAWYGDRDFDYTYSKTTKKALPWTETLQVIKKEVELKSGETYNSCLLNLYHTGGEGMGWHTDAERELKRDGAIASVSLGAERKFAFKHKETKEVVSLLLEHGSLLVMKGKTQLNWLHRLPPTAKVKNPRINLTFRTIVT